MEQEALVPAPEKEFVGVAGVEVRPPVDLAGGQTVAEHLRHVFCRHLHALDALWTVVRPELEVVAVAALVVHPGGAVSPGLALGVVGAMVPLEVLHPGPELHRGVLAEIVGQPLPVQPQSEAVFPHQRPMMIHGFQMAPEVHGPRLLFLRS